MGAGAALGVRPHGSVLWTGPKARDVVANGPSVLLYMQYILLE
jgi:hypothetical protein